MCKNNTNVCLYIFFIVKSLKKTLSPTPQPTTVSPKTDGTTVSAKTEPTTISPKEEPTTVLPKEEPTTQPTQPVSAVSMAKGISLCYVLLYVCFFI